jgi:hypothetical protein
MEVIFVAPFATGYQSEFEKVAFFLKKENASRFLASEIRRKKK